MFLTYDNHRIKYKLNKTYKCLNNCKSSVTIQVLLVRLANIKKFKSVTFEVKCIHASEEKFK